MSADPFPNELVEAAAKALRTSEIPITLSPTEGWVFDADESARAVLAAVFPLIEQRVIDRLARETARASMTDPFPNTPRNEEDR